MPWFPPFVRPLLFNFFILGLLPLFSPVFSETLYLKKQFGDNEHTVEEWGKMDCSLNEFDLTALGLERSCEEWPDLAPIYCDGKIIEAVNYWGERMLFLRDSKHFVDRPLKKEAKKVVEQFKAMFNVTEWKKFVVSDMSPAQVDQLSKFVRENFGMADESPIPQPGALLPHVPEDWVETKPFETIKDGKLRKWAKQLNKMWKEMSRKMPKEMNGKGNQQNSLIYVSNPFMVPGGRFREFRYWDAYLIARGLIASGMTASVKNMCKNFAEMVNRFGFVPAGGRIYYNKRSQPPFLTLMVYDYFGATGDIKFLKEILPVLEKELDFWRTKRSIEVDVKGRKKTFYQYRADTNLPRPEAFCQDVNLVKNISDPKEKAKVWRDIASTSESGWNFSSRWIKKDETDKENPWKLTNLMTTKIVPVDLNALICGNLEMLAHLYLQIDDKTKSSEYHRKFQLFLEDFQSLFYKKEHGIWYDYNLESGGLNEMFYGSAAMPLFARCYHTVDVDTAERMFRRMEQFDKDNKMLSHPFGVPASAVNSAQQWDFPNVWPPLQHMLIDGLRRSFNSRMEDKAKELAQKWVSANFKLYQNSQSCGKKMWEKLTADGGTPGSGGEYSVQIGFGWTVGAMLDLLVTYGTELTAKGVAEMKCDNKIMEAEPLEFPNELTEYRSELLTEAQKKVDEINKSQKDWTAVVYEPFALMTDEEFKQLLGADLEVTNGPYNRQQLQWKGNFEVEKDYKDLPKEFDARQKWPECADIISNVPDQGRCGSCWAVQAAATLTDRICIARLKKGQKTDSKDPRAYVSAQYTLEATPESKGCKNGTNPRFAWNYYRNMTVSGTNYEMYDGCKPYTIGPIAERKWWYFINPFGSLTDDASWKTREPNCNNKCKERYLKRQFPDGQRPWEPFIHEASIMPAVTDPVAWISWNGKWGEKRINGQSLELEMMREIMANGSIQAGFEVFDDFKTTFKNDRNQIYSHSPNSKSMGRGHALKIIGWGQLYWLAVNSWGKSWGHNGMMKIRRGINEGGIESLSVHFGAVNCGIRRLRRLLPQQFCPWLRFQCLFNKMCSSK
uniref:Trehalase n=1 Tax=Globodera rostochiensis TaxID=31243 RepID=A0A914H7A0_GLORO